MYACTRPSSPRNASLVALRRTRASRHNRDGELAAPRAHTRDHSHSRFPELARRVKPF